MVHFVDPIWLGAQMICGMGWGLGGEKWVEDGRDLGGAVVASYHTYASLFILHLTLPADLFDSSHLSSTHQPTNPLTEI